MMRLTSLTFVLVLIALSGCGHTVTRVRGASPQKIEGVWVPKVKYAGDDHEQVIRLDLAERDYFYLPGGWWEATIVPYTPDTMGRWKHLGKLQPDGYEPQELLQRQADGKYIRFPVTRFYWYSPLNDVSRLPPGEYDVELLSICPHFEGAGGEVFRAIRHLCVGYAVHVILVVPERQSPSGLIPK